MDSGHVDIPAAQGSRTPRTRKQWSGSILEGWAAVSERLASLECSGRAHAYKIWLVLVSREALNTNIGMPLKTRQAAKMKADVKKGCLSLRLWLASFTEAGLIGGTCLIVTPRHQLVIQQA